MPSFSTLDIHVSENIYIVSLSPVHLMQTQAFAVVADAIDIVNMGCSQNWFMLMYQSRGAAADSFLAHGEVQSPFAGPPNRIASWVSLISLGNADVRVTNSSSARSGKDCCGDMRTASTANTSALNSTRAPRTSGTQSSGFASRASHTSSCRSAIVKLRKLGQCVGKNWKPPVVNLEI